MGNWDWKWICIVMMLIGGYMYYDNSSKYGLTKDLLTRGVTAPGTIYDGQKTTRRKGGTTCKVKFRFKPEGQDSRKAELEVSSSYFDSVSIDTQIEVLYLKEDPNQCMIKGQELASEGSVTFALVILVLGAAGSGWMAVDYALSAKNSRD